MAVAGDHNAVMVALDAECIPTIIPKRYDRGWLLRRSPSAFPSVSSATSTSL